MVRYAISHFVVIIVMSLVHYQLLFQAKKQKPFKKLLKNNNVGLGPIY